MAQTIFFSWQADAPTKVGRNLIERALQGAVGSLASDATLEPADRNISVDRDTAGVPGSPTITDTIFKKIDGAAVFVADLTFVGRRLDGRPTPNPNVLIEYGWALKARTDARIICVMNTAFGEPTADQMPFNLRHRRNPITYYCPGDATADERSAARSSLQKKLQVAIRAILQADDLRPAPLAQQPFLRQTPVNGPGRFRLPGHNIGVYRERGLRQIHHEVLLANGAAMWLRVMPTTDPGRTWRPTELEQAATENGYFLIPLGSHPGGYAHLRVHDGFGVAEAGSTMTETSAVAFAFTTGEIWAINTALVAASQGSDYSYIPLRENEFADALSAYSGLLARLGIAPPYHWMAGIEGVRTRGLWPQNYRPLIPAPLGFCTKDVVEAEGEHSSDQDAAASLEPFFAAVYDACSVERSSKR